jgi:hypothetical protein
MPQATARKSSRHDPYWEKRVRSKEFIQAVTALFAEEITALSGQRIKDVVDARLVRRIIAEWDGRMVDHDSVADLVIAANTVVEQRLRAKNTSVLGLLDEHLVAGIEAILAEDIVLSKQVEDFIEKVMQQEFVRSLFTDIIYTSIVAFYERINPLFGGMTLAILEGRVKGFIRLFMPMVQREATNFAISTTNQRLFSTFARSIVRQVLSEPLPQFFAAASSGRRRHVEALVKKSIDSGKLESLVRELALAAWDDVYKRIRNRKVSDILHVEEHARWLAERATDVIVPMLSRPRVLRLVAAEVARATARQDRRKCPIDGPALSRS